MEGQVSFRWKGVAKPSQRSASQLAALVVRHDSNGRLKGCCLCKRLARGVCSEHSGRHSHVSVATISCQSHDSIDERYVALFTDSANLAYTFTQHGRVRWWTPLPQQSRVEPNSSGTAISSDLAQFPVDQGSISSFARQLRVWKGRHRLGQ